jgi:hypothetical protein
VLHGSVCSKVQIVHEPHTSVVLRGMHLWLWKEPNNSGDKHDADPFKARMTQVQFNRIYLIVLFPFYKEPQNW